jgi:hypothetical protein
LADTAVIIVPAGGSPRLHWSVSQYTIPCIRRRGWSSPQSTVSRTTRGLDDRHEQRHERTPATPVLLSGCVGVVRCSLRFGGAR